MSEQHFFYEAGTIGGIPGTFAGVVVEVDEAHTRIISINPLPRHLAFEPAPVEEAPPLEGEEEANTGEQAGTTPEQQPSLPAESPASDEASQAQV